MRIAAIDIGSNSTRLLVADVVDGQVRERFRRSTVTRLADGVDTSGELDGDARERVHAVLADYATQLADDGCERAVGVATSAVRDATNGEEFAREIFRRHGLRVEVIDGNREAELTFSGVATSDSYRQTGRTLVVDIGGGSTEFILGDGDRLAFNTSCDLGAVRQSERHLRSDPPTVDELGALLDEAGSIVRADVPADLREGVAAGTGVAGTPTVLAAVDQALEPFDPWKVHGYAITEAACAAMLERLAALPLVERQQVPGLHPDRAPTIVAGAAILLTTLREFGLSEIVVSEHDLLYGLAKATPTNPRTSRKA